MPLAAGSELRLRHRVLSIVDECFVPFVGRMPAGDADLEIISRECFGPIITAAGEREGAQRASRLSGAKCCGFLLSEGT